MDFSNNLSYNTNLFYTKKYSKLYCHKDDEVFQFNYSEGEYYFANIALKKPILNIGNLKLKKEYFDLETPYGFGGYLTNSTDQNFIETAFKKYKNEMAENNIISEFIRFNVFNEFPITHKSFFNFLNFERNTVLIDLSKDYEGIQSSYKSSLKRNIKKAKGNDLTFQIVEKNKFHIDFFMKLYYQTMDKNNASQFYYFDKNYFYELCSFEEVKLVAVKFNDEISNMAILIEDNKVIYYHLGASNPTLYSFNGNSLIFDSIARKFSTKKNFLFLGGGNSKLETDSLYRFKKKFSDIVKPFYVGGLIFSERYYEFCDIRLNQSKNEIPFFLKYRF